MRCLACGHDNPEESQFCFECGARLAITCPNCGHELPPGVKFCNRCGTDLRPAATPPAQTVQSLPVSFAAGRYSVSRFLGEGGKKQVYLVHDTLLDRDVAFSLIKTDGLDELGIERIRREARVMGRLGGHPHIVSVFDMGEEAGRPFLVSELMAGGDVEGLIAAAPEHRPPLETTLRIAEQVCQALEYAHSHGVIHRDLKPGNVWLAADGTAKLGDFGLAVAIDRTRLSIAGMIVGTVGYMPPEQALGRPPDARSDLYSLGAMLYELVTGRPPFLGDDPVSIISQHVNTPPVAPSWHNPRVPRPLEALILRLLEKDPERRPASAAGVRGELAGIVAGPAGATTSEQRAATEPANPLERLAGGIFVGRERELDSLRAALDAALSGQSGIALLAGEPGIGKTRLAEELGTYATLRGAQVLWSRAYEWEGAPAYWAWVQLIRDYVHNRDPQALRSELGSGAGEIGRIVSEVRERLPGLPDPGPAEGEAARFRLFESITTFLKNASNAQPLVLVFDDLQWADKPSLLLLQFAVRELRGARVLLVGTYRDSEVGRRHPLGQTLAELAREPRTQRLVLRQLGRADISRYLHLTTGQSVAERVVDGVYGETDGNPFFLTEVVRLLASEGRLDAARSNSWSDTLPQGVRDVIGRRLERLSSEANEILSIAAVIGREFGLAHLERAADLPRDELLDRLDEALEARIIEEGASGDRYRFNQELVQETLYQELSIARRRRLNGKVAAALEALHARDLAPHFAELAHYYALAGPVGDSEKAIDYALKAGDRAMGQLAWETAVKHYEQALQVLELLPETNDTRTCDVLLRLGKAQWLSGMVEEGRVTTQRAADLARTNSLPEQFAEAAQGFSGGWIGPTYSEASRESVALLEEALTMLPAGDGMVRFQIAGRLSHYLIEEVGDAERAQALAEEVHEMARRISDPHALLEAIVFKWSALQSPDMLDQRLAIARDSLDAFRAALPPDDVASATLAITFESISAGEEVEFSSDLAAAPDVMEESRQPQRRFYGSLNRGRLELVQGKFARAERSFQRALAVGQSAMPGDEAEQWVGMQLFVLRREQGRLEELDPLVARWGLPPARRDEGLVTWIWQFIAVLHSWERGRVEQTREIVERLTGTGLRDMPWEGTWLGNLAILAEVSTYLGDRDQAAELYGLLLPYSARVVMWSSLWIPLGPVAYYLGLLATLLERWSDVERHFESSINTSERVGAPAWVAHSRYALANMLVKRSAPGDHERALALIDQALATADETGMVRLAGLALALKVQVQGILKA